MIDKICQQFQYKYKKDYQIIIVKNGYIPDIVKDLENQNIKITKFFCGEDRK